MLQRIVTDDRTTQLQSPLRDFPFKEVILEKSKSEGRYSVRSGGDGTSGSQRAPHGILHVNERNR
jgi:hypothetical protein